jgi:hypothetical protein
MAPSALDERPERAPEPDVDFDPDRRSPRPVPRHRYADESASNGSHDRDLGPADADADEPADHDADDREREGPDLGLRPESVARLSDADRQLLARLQADLLDGRRQRITRRITNGSGATANGSHRGPPDLAG